MDQNPDTLTARLTPWFIRRMFILFLMFAGFGGWFGYDWQVGYPKKAAIYSEYLGYRDKGEEGMREWARVSVEKKYKIEDEKSMAPPKIDAGKIKEQFFAMLVCFAVSALVLAYLVRSLGTALRVDGTTLFLPRSAPIAIADIVRVDTRKWMSKGLAYVWHKTGGAERKAVLDGMKYGGFKGDKPYLPDQILARVVDTFQGELIELQEEPAVDENAPT